MECTGLPVEGGVTLSWTDCAGAEGNLFLNRRLLAANMLCHGLLAAG